MRQVVETADNFNNNVSLQLTFTSYKFLDGQRRQLNGFLTEDQKII